MIVVDDLLVRPFVSIVEAIQALAIQELYDVDAIRDEMKENRLLYELGDRGEEEYERRRQELDDALQAAETAHEQLQDKQIRVRG